MDKFFAIFTKENYLICSTIRTKQEWCWRKIESSFGIKSEKLIKSGYTCKEVTISYE